MRYRRISLILGLTLALATPVRALAGVLPLEEFIQTIVNSAYFLPFPDGVASVLPEPGQERACPGKVADGASVPIQGALADWLRTRDHHVAYSAAALEQQIEAMIGKSRDGEILFAFDFDKVLFNPDPSDRELHRQQPGFDPRYVFNHPEEYTEFLRRNLEFVVPPEPAIPRLFNRLSRRFPTLVVTARYANFRRATELTAQALGMRGVPLELTVDATVLKESIERGLREINSNLCRSPDYANSFVYTCRGNKGVAIQRIRAALRQKVRRVVLIDDKLLPIAEFHSAFYDEADVDVTSIQYVRD